jgi:hypothetical protein
LRLLYDFEAYREIHLVFMNTEFAGDWILKDGFRHVYAIERSALGWTCTDPSKSDMHTYILPASFESDVMAEFTRQHPGFTTLHLKVEPHTDSIYPQLGVISCVSMMQYILGVYWPFVFTPYQLFNKLMSKPPKHIEVIACHDIKYTQHKGKPSMQLRQQTRQGSI